METGNKVALGVLGVGGLLLLVAATSTPKPPPENSNANVSIYFTPVNVGG